MTCHDLACKKLAKSQLSLSLQRPKIHLDTRENRR